MSRVQHSDSLNSTEVSETICNVKSWIGLGYTKLACGPAAVKTMVTPLANRTQFMPNEIFAAEKTTSGIPTNSSSTSNPYASATAIATRIIQSFNKPAKSQAGRFVLDPWQIIALWLVLFVMIGFVCFASYI